MTTANQTKRLPRPLEIALGLFALAVVNVVSVMILGNAVLAFLGFVMVFLALVAGGLYVLIGLAVNRPHDRSSWRTHVIALAVVAGTFCLLVFAFRGGVFGLLRFRMNTLIALTGGQDELQSWAVELLAKPRELMEYEEGHWSVPRQYWSEQVRRLRPVRVRIEPVVKEGQEGVWLFYRIPHSGWAICVGPPGTVPPEDDRFLGMWFRIGDGLYHWSSG